MRLRGARGRRRCSLSWSLKHAGLRRLQETTVVRGSPIDRANRLFSSDVANCTADQHLRLKCRKPFRGVFRTPDTVYCNNEGILSRECVKVRKHRVYWKKTNDNLSLEYKDFVVGGT